MSGSMVILVAAQVVMLSSAVTVYCVHRRFQFWRRHAGHMQESGYLVPPSTVPARLAWRVLTRLAVYLVVGPIKVSGRNNLNVSGRKIYVPNHQFELDFAMTAVATRSACPIMTSAEVLKPPIAALLAAWTGAIPVNVHQEDGGQKALDASIQTLLRSPEAEFIVFPQGKLLDDLSLEDFKPGAARMQAEVARLTGGEPVFLIPVHIAYARNARFKPFSHLFLRKLRGAMGKVNYGGNVCIGRPIAFDPARSAEQTTALIYACLAWMQSETNRISNFRHKR